MRSDSLISRDCLFVCDDVEGRGTTFERWDFWRHGLSRPIAQQSPSRFTAGGGSPGCGKRRRPGLPPPAINDIRASDSADASTNPKTQWPAQPSLFSFGSGSRMFAADAAAAVMPAHTSLAKLLATHVLRDGELVILVLRPSLWFILLSSMRFVIACLLAIFATRYFGGRSMWSHGTMRSLEELAVSCISARLMWATLQWMSRLYILTDMRVLILSGVFSVNIFDCPLRKVARTRLIRSSIERVASVGSIEIIPQDDELPFGQWQMIAQPIAVHEQLLAAISRAKQGSC